MSATKVCPECRVDSPKSEFAKKIGEFYLNGHNMKVSAHRLTHTACGWSILLCCE